jgi:hypothetical protein
MSHSDEWYWEVGGKYGLCEDFGWLIDPNNPDTCMALVDGLEYVIYDKDGNAKITGECISMESGQRHIDMFFERYNNERKTN